MTTETITVLTVVLVRNSEAWKEIGAGQRPIGPYLVDALTGVGGGVAHETFED